MRTEVGILLILALLGVLVGSSVLFGGCAPAAGGTPITQTPVINTPPVQVPTAEMPGIKDIAVEDADALIRANLNNTDFVVIDVRTSVEYAQGHIWRSNNLDYNSPTFRDELGKLDKNNTYLVYCRTGKRSAAARDVMVELGFTKIYNITGGFDQWQAAGLPIVNP